jgi:hypothetical protein
VVFTATTVVLQQGRLIREVLPAFRIVIAKTRQTVKKISSRRLTDWHGRSSCPRSGAAIGRSESRLYLLPPSKMGARLEQDRLEKDLLSLQSFGIGPIKVD